MRRIAASVCLALALVVVAAAQPSRVETISSTASAVRFYVSSNGIFALNPASASGSFFYPSQTTASYIFGGGLWFGAQKVVDGARKKLVFITYNPSSGASWAQPGERNVSELGSAESDSNVDAHIYTSVDYSVGSGQYLGSDTGRCAWPLWLTGKDGFSALPLNTGTFDPYIPLRGKLHAGSGGVNNGPAFVAGPSEQIVTRFHDNSLADYEIVDGIELAGYPIGLQVEENVFAWTSGKYRNVVVVQYHVRNISSDTLYNCVVGQVSDPDLGVSSNDHLRFYNDRPDLRTGLCWSDPDSTGTYGTLVMSLIEAPNVDQQGLIDNSDRRLFHTAGRVGSFPYWSLMEDPKTSAERYNFMTNDSFASDIKAEDQRAMLASGTFTMRPGDTAHFAMMYAVLDSAPPHEIPGRKRGLHISTLAVPWNDLEALITSINNDYYSPRGFDTESSSSLPPVMRQAAFNADVVPNPAGDEAFVRFTLAGQSAVKMRLVNSLGQVLVQRDLATLKPGDHAERIDLAGYPAGFYMAVIETDTGVHAVPMTIRR